MTDNAEYRLQAEKERWEQAFKGSFTRERKKDFYTEDGIPIKRVYTPLDLKEQKFDYIDSLGFPGEYPFTRGNSPTGYRELLRECGQYAGSSSPEETNRLLKELYAAGNAAIHLAFDIASKQGYDSDDPVARGDVGKCGMAWNSLLDLEILFDGIDLANMEVTYVYVPFAIFALAQHVVLGAKQGHSADQLKLVLQNDVLQGYSANNQYIFPPVHGMRLAIDSATYIAQNMPKSIAFHLCMYHLGEAGADKVKQIAICLSSAIAYIDEVLKRGVDIDLIAPKFKLLAHVTHRDFLVEIAKLRAFRRMWAKLMREHYGAKNSGSWKITMRGSGGGIVMTKDLEINIGRVALTSLCSALVGADDGGGATYDEAWGIPSKKAKMDSIRMHTMIHDETGVMDVIDPLGGSYYVESLTSELEEKAWKYMEKIKDAGGMLEAVASGLIQRDIAADMLRDQRRIDSKEKILIGLNKFVQEHLFEKKDYYKPNPDILRIQTEKLRKIRAERNNQRVQKCLDEIKKIAARGPGPENNMVLPIIEASKAYATCGEICKALKEVFGIWEGPGHVL